MTGVISNVHLGVPVVDADGRLVIYAEAHAALAAFQPYVVRPAQNTAVDKSGFLTGGGLPGTAAANDGKAVTAAPGTLAVNHWIGAPQQAYAIGDIAKLVIGGAGKCLLNGDFRTNVFVKVAAAGIYGVPDTTAQTVNGFALCTDPSNITSTTATNVQFLAVPAQV
jgi:hypothetical protein